MKIYSIQFPGHMERCTGFTVPDDGVFYALYFEDSLARFDILSGRADCIQSGELKVHDDLSVFELDGVRHLFVGHDGSHAIHHRDGIGDLSLAHNKATLVQSDGTTQSWQFENFSGDWEQVTLDASRNAFLFGAPYDFDFKYVDLTVK